GSTGGSSGTCRCRTASRGALSMRRAPKPRSAFARAPSFATDSSRRLRGIANRCMQFVRRVVEAVPPVVTASVLVLLQLLAVAARAHGEGWHRSRGAELLAALLLAAQVVLVYAIVDLVGGRTAALFAGLVLIVGPVVLAKKYFISGGGTPPILYRDVYRHDVLPTQFGLTGQSGLIAGCLILFSALLLLVRVPLPAWASGAGSGAAVAAAVLVYPRAWLVLGAPVVATLVARRLQAAAAALAVALVGLLALAVFRDVPHVAFGWHQMGQSLDSLREFSWSRRVLEYLPLAGVVGLARPSAPTAPVFGGVLVAAGVPPLSRPPRPAGLPRPHRPGA